MDRDPGDPPAPWETPVSGAEALRIGAAVLRSRPYRPNVIEDVPTGAVRALQDACGELTLEQMFVVPRQSRMTNRRGKGWVLTPVQVVGFGARKVALWVGDPAGAGVRVAATVADLAAIVDRTILLYGRVELVAAHASLVIRYNTVAREELWPSLLAVRRAMAGPPVPTTAAFNWPGHHSPSAHPELVLPYKWQVILRSRVVRMDPGGPVMVAVGAIDNTRARRPGIAVLGSRELVIVVDPTEDVRNARYGFDITAVTRTRLRSLAWNGRSLIVRTGPTANGARGSVEDEGAAVTVPMDGSLADAMRAAFADVVHWD
jgi:hypothetical protein